MDLTSLRIANARKAMEAVGGVNKAAAKMGYANAAFLSQIFGPNPTRSPTEKTMRRLEKALELEEGSLDKEAAPELPAQSAVVTTQIDPGQLAQVITLVNRLLEEEKVSLPTDRFANLVAVAYDEAAEHAGQARESKLRQVVRLLR
ncbi:hypothetical protein [Delftia sp. ZNC0008]|uniref:hypothetical protein n=1 Tax=Delftia sp. ZNC0008 TaxID=1339242 RepID=UPI0012DFF86B|nr:hypothetical protein [Delftia sp. ZNC0008]